MVFHAHGRDKGERQTRIEKWRRIKERELAKGKELILDKLDNAPELSYEVGYIWQLYWDIKRGVEHVDLNALSAWQTITGVSFSPFEVEALIEIDSRRRYSD